MELISVVRKLISIRLEFLENTEMLESTMSLRNRSTLSLVVIAILQFAGFAVAGFAVCSTASAIQVDDQRQPQSAVKVDRDRLANFFESRIRPILVDQCYGCHNSVGDAEADFALDWLTGIRATTEHGTGVVPGDPDASLLIKVIEHQIEGLEMPSGGAKFTPAVIADFKQWVAAGAVDTRLERPTKKELEAATSWAAKLESRKQWWSFQPIRSPQIPPENEWSNHEVDRFIWAALGSNSLVPSHQAKPRTLVRRLAFAITGLPPTLQQLADVESGTKSLEQFVDELLASPHFGERWARHWMDLVRYSDSHGSEGDPAIPNAYRYRDYLIRALNADVPYDRLVREHIAGDLLSTPRINHELGINESAIGPAHWRLCFHGFAPTDALDEKVRFTDDQINVFSKAFLGLTVSCARCHDHKFDPISQADYYALFGIVGSSRPATRDANSSVQKKLHQPELLDLKGRIKRQLAAHWLTETDELKSKLFPLRESDLFSPEHPLVEVQKILAQPETSEGQGGVAVDWSELRQKWNQQKQENITDAQQNVRHWGAAGGDSFDEWFGDGSPALTANRSEMEAGKFSLSFDGENVIDQIFPSGVYSNLISNRHRGVFESPSFSNLAESDSKDGDTLTAWMKILGGGQASARYVVQDYPRNGTVYPIQEIKNSKWHWQKFDLGYWRGDELHLELATAKDAPLQTRNSDRSWFGVREVVLRKSKLGPPMEFNWEALAPFFLDEKFTPTTQDALAEHCLAVIQQTILAWRDGTATNGQAMLLDGLVQGDVLSNQLRQIETVQQNVMAYRVLESKIPLPFRVPGVAEAGPTDQPLFERGNHKLPRETVRRRFLEAIDATPYETEQSGRLELANDLFRDDNPLTARVAVNRIWLHLFGQGIVATPDNFGRLGELPSHPELLDYLANRMVDENWSIKKMIRSMVLSKAWQQSSNPSDAASKFDPTNRFLSHYPIRRLEAESIRDALMMTAGSFSDEMYGPGFAANSSISRRSVYIRSNRNNLDRFLTLFDSPVPFSTTGRRSVTHVPAQSLALMNSKLVIEMANRWAASVRESSLANSSDGERIKAMFRKAMGRDPSSFEAEFLIDYLRVSKFEAKQIVESRARHVDQQGRTENAIAAILDPVRADLLQQRNGETGEVSLAPVLHWDFSKSETDLIEGQRLSLKSGARIEDGKLVLDGNGFALSPNLKRAFGAKTLEAWVQLSDLGQQGGGVVTIQSPSGSEFDSIVFAESSKYKWMAGSEFLRRSLSFEGIREKEADQSPIHIAMTFAEDGTIAAFRNGEPYGQSIRKSPLHAFKAGESKIALGIRHGVKSQPGRMLKGSLHQVRVYDRALTADELRASFLERPWVSEAEIVAALPSDQQTQLRSLRENLKRHVAALASLDTSAGPHDPLAKIAHAIFNIKEFIYIR
ncbi:MAG: hypothetical protein ACI87E_000184 [Mariniblastus sp.]|jgi:hypothetical protein